MIANVNVDAGSSINRGLWRYNPGEERGKQPFQLSFNRFLRVTFQCSQVTFNGGLLLVGELDERLRFGSLIEQHLTDSRTINVRFFTDLLRQSVYSRLTGWPQLQHPRTRFRYPPGMKSRLQKLVRKTEVTGFQDPEKAGWGRWDCLGENIGFGGLDWNHTGVYSQSSEGQKIDTGLKLKVEIPV